MQCMTFDANGNPVDAETLERYDEFMELWKGEVKANSTDELLEDIFQEEWEAGLEFRDMYGKNYRLGELFEREHPSPIVNNSISMLEILNTDGELVIELPYEVVKAHFTVQSWMPITTVNEDIIGMRVRTNQGAGPVCEIQQDPDDPNSVVLKWSQSVGYNKDEVLSYLRSGTWFVDQD